MFMHICLHLDKYVTSGESNNPLEFATQFFWFLRFN